MNLWRPGETWAAGFCNSNCNASWSRRKPSIAGLDNGGGKRYHTPLGTLELTRRVYDPDGDCLGEQALGLPPDGWFSSVKELGCALGVGSEFAHANRLLERWSGVVVSERT